MGVVVRALDKCGLLEGGEVGFKDGNYPGIGSRVSQVVGEPVVARLGIGNGVAEEDLEVVFFSPGGVRNMKESNPSFLSA